MRVVRRPLLALLALAAIGACSPEQAGTLEVSGSLAFGDVKLGEQAVRSLRFVNSGHLPVRLSGFESELPEGLRARAGGDVLEVPGRGELSVEVTCAPTRGGLRAGSLVLTADQAGAPRIAIPFRCAGVGPQLLVVPEAVAFGRVLYPHASQRTVALLNVGAGPAEPLRIVSAQVVPLDANTTATELTVEPPGGARGALGYGPGKNELVLTLVLRPQTPGPKRAELRLVTNDPIRPEVSVTIGADAVPPEPCRYRTVPDRLLLGLVSGGPGSGAHIVIENLGTQPGEVCELRDLALSAASAPELSLAGAPSAPVLLHPGKSLTVVVEVGPSSLAAPAGFEGALQFRMVNAPNAQGSVPITGTFAPVGCLVVVPDDLNFGMLYARCSSRVRDFTLYNTCSRPLTLTSFAASSAGQPGIEFFLHSIPAMPPGGLIMAPGGAPFIVRVAYRPVDSGPDSGALLITAAEPGGVVTRVVSLSGEGETTPEHDDVYLIDSPPKVDLLLVLDDSTSMADQQATMASNFQKLINRLLADFVDFHVGVITADDRPGAGQGRLIGDASNPKVLTRAFANVEAAFLAKVNVGASSSAPPAGISTALEALSAPLASTDNAGFLRPDATLSIVIVSDGRDTSPGPVADYLAAFRLLKPSSPIVFFSVIGPFSSVPPAGCTYDTLADDGRYAEFANGPGPGVEICDSTWWSWFDPPQFPPTTFFLNAVPDPGAVTVLINGAPLAASAYDYDRHSNAVEFPVSAPPPPGSTLTIRYRTCP